MQSYNSFRLQELISISGNQTQSINVARDIGGFRTLVVMTRIATTGASTGTLALQHAPVLHEDAFVDVGAGNVALNATGNTVYVHTNLLRFVRWSVTGFTGTTTQFLIDVVAKEN